MKKSFLFNLCVTIATIVHSGNAQTQIEPPQKAQGHMLTDEGAWCWFADPRAVHHQNVQGTINKTYIGYIDVHGNIKATQYNFFTGQAHEVLIRSYFQPDDHNNPTFLILPDDRVMIFYSRHTDEPCFYYRISQRPGDITALGQEFKITTDKNTTYPSPFILSDDPNHFYLCWRGINWHPTIAKLTIPDTSDETKVVWGPHQLVQSTASRPYAKYASNGKDKIYMAYTTGHPDVTIPNYIYFNYIDIKSLQLTDVGGKVISTIADGPHKVTASDDYTAAYPDAVVDNPTTRGWLWQVAMDNEGIPAIATVCINDTKNSHDYYYVKWTGKEWRKTFLANAGGHFHQSPDIELCYSGGMAIDDQHPEEIYCSLPIEGKSGKVYELVKFTINPDGSMAPADTITANSTHNNVRPYIVPKRNGSPLKITWMHGNYFDWIVSKNRPLGYPTAIYADYQLPATKVDLAHQLSVTEHFNEPVKGTAAIQNGQLLTTSASYSEIPTKKAKSFTINLTPQISGVTYGGTIVRFNNVTYGLNSQTQKPYLTINDHTYESANVLGTADSWQNFPRGTNGKWYDAQKLERFHLTLTYANGVFTTYINGLIDQVVPEDIHPLKNVTIGGFDGTVDECLVYRRALSQEEVKALMQNEKVLR
ncbi:MAG: BNR-4 repeat-containing protein [Breznakibacter sp.]